MGISFEYPRGLDNQQMDHLLATYALSATLEDIGWEGRPTGSLYGWFAFTTQLGRGVLGLIVQRSHVFTERHSYLPMGSTITITDKQPVHNECAAQDCSMSEAVAEGLLSWVDLGYSGAAPTLWPVYDERRLITGVSNPLAVMQKCTITSDRQTVGVRLAALSERGHVIRNEFLGGLAATAYTEYFA